MKKIIILMVCLWGLGNTFTSAQTTEKEKFISSLMKQMTLDEKIGQLAQCTYRGNFTGPDGGNIPKEEYVRQGRIGSMLNVIGVKDIRRYQELALQSRLRIPLIFGLDVIHGYRTGFPLPLAEAASFDLAMIEEAARYNALESAADGLNWVFAPMVDISWDARWGRVMEGAGEDPYYGSRVAEARVRGLQGDDLADTTTVMACMKHFAGYGAPIAGKEYNSVDMSMGHFANFYMPPYKAAIKVGAATVMSAFNDFNNIPCTANDFLLNRLLREQWGFKGFVVSDYNSVEELVNHRYAVDKKDAAAKALNAGLDMEMVSTCYLTYLKELVQEGKVKESVLDDAVRCILEKKYELGLFEDPFRYCNPERAARILNAPEVRNASLRMAERSVVLLENRESVLPLTAQTRKIALIGGLSKSQYDMAGAWAATTDRNKVVTLYDALVRNTALKQTYKASYIDASTEPAYPFGYGLSYTDFGYSDLKLLPGKAAGVHTEVSVKVTNTGKCAGEEVVQLYVQDKVASVTRPIKELKGFRKIHLNVGESKTVAFQITDDALGFYDNEMNYMVEPGDFVFMVGGSSDDVQQITYNLKE